MTVRIDERTNKSQIEFETPDIPLDRDSVYGMATFSFIVSLSSYIALHCANRRYIPFDALEGTSFYQNDASSFENDYFIMHSYDWSYDWHEYDEDFDYEEWLNRDCFLDKESGAALSWYKYAPRGLCANRALYEMLENDTLGDMLNRLHKTLDA